MREEKKTEAKTISKELETLIERKLQENRVLLKLIKQLEQNKCLSDNPEVNLNNKGKIE
ncbi:MAG: hypothetical protein K0B15_12200 [Lentimicrobium sp.]|nr:hypothetical protein [Lentimicrobium sp.]